MIDFDLPAILNRDKSYRYWLRRDLIETSDPYQEKRCLFIMLNPSTADHTLDDPTIRRCKNYAASWGYNTMGVVNLFAYRCSSPNMMMLARDPVGDDNDHAISKALAWAVSNDGIIVCAWGNHGMYLDRHSRVLKKLNTPQYRTRTYCLDVSKSGQPVHPLYQRKDIELKPLFLELKKYAASNG